MDARILRDNYGQRGIITYPTSEKDPLAVAYDFGSGEGGEQPSNVRHAASGVQRLLQHYVNMGWVIADGRPGPAPKYKRNLPEIAVRISTRGHAGDNGIVEITGTNVSFSTRWVRFGLDLPEPAETMALDCSPEQPWFIGEETTIGVQAQAAIERSSRKTYRIASAPEYYVRQVIGHHLYSIAQAIQHGAGGEPSWVEVVRMLRQFPAAEIGEVFGKFARAYRARPRPTPSKPKPDRQITLEDD